MAHVGEDLQVAAHRRTKLAVHLMGYQVYERNGRDMGYGVPSLCDQPGCNAYIDRGLGYLCGKEPGGDELGCGLYFCSSHLYYGSNGACQCDRCLNAEEPYEPKPDTPEWVNWKLTDPSWGAWRMDHMDEVQKLSEELDVLAKEWIS